MEYSPDLSLSDVDDSTRTYKFSIHELYPVHQHVAVRILDRTKHYVRYNYVYKDPIEKEWAVLNMKTFRQKVQVKIFGLEEQNLRQEYIRDKLYNDIVSPFAQYKKIS